MKETKQCLAEFLGTFYLCFAGIAAILCTKDPINSGAGLVGIALAHGLALSAAICVFGGLSGAHFNPAVTIAMLATGRIKIPLAISYIAAQLLGRCARIPQARGHRIRRERGQRECRRVGCQKR